jgi:hypothetical protein
LPIAFASNAHPHHFKKSRKINLEAFTANVNACRDPRIDVNRLITFIRLRSRLDLEQGAAAVVSAFMADGRIGDASKLVREMEGVLGAAHCWIEAVNDFPGRNADEVAAFTGLAGKVVAWFGLARVEVQLPGTYAQLVPLLLRVRSSRPKDRSRGLYVPEWMVKEAKIEPPVYMKEFWKDVEDTGMPDKGLLADQ